MSENTKKKKYAFNVFDVFIILLVIILIASAVYRISQTSAEKANQDNPVYTVYFECDGEYESLAKYLSDGEEVYIKSTGELLGYIYKSADMLGDTAIHVKDDGTQAPMEEPTEAKPKAESETADLYERVDFVGKLKLNGNAVKGREGSYYTVEELNITVGSVIEVYTDDTEFTIIVKQIADKDGE